MGIIQQPTVAYPPDLSKYIDRLTISADSTGVELPLSVLQQRDERKYQRWVQFTYAAAPFAGGAWTLNITKQIRVVSCVVFIENNVLGTHHTTINIGPSIGPYLSIGYFGLQVPIALTSHCITHKISAWEGLILPGREVPGLQVIGNFTGTATRFNVTIIGELL